jgi:hypothetical protein
VAALLGVVALLGLVLRRVRVPRWRVLLIRFAVGAGLVLIVAAVISLAHLLLDQYDPRRNEPVTLSDGISIWPTEAIRAFAIVLGALLLVKAYLDLRANEEALHRRFGVPSPDDAVINSTRHPYRIAWRSLLRWRIHKGVVDAERVWRQYLRLGRPSTSWLRISVMSGIYIVAAMSAFLVFGFPHVPYRGDFSWWVDFVVLVTAVCVQVAVIFFVVDSIRLCTRLIDHLGSGPTKWLPEVKTKEANVLGINSDDVGEYLDIQFVAIRTAPVGKLILYPFLVLVLMVIARLAYFDNWDWPPALLLVFGVNFLYAILCQWILFSAATRIRRNNIAQMREVIREMPARDEDRIAGLEKLIKEMESERKGAFAPINEQPLAAVLLSTLALGVWQIALKFLQPL